MLKIKAIRRRMKIEEKELCDELNIDLGLLKSIETGKVLPDEEVKEQLKKFFKANGVTIKDEDFVTEVKYKDFQLNVKKYKGNKVLYLGKEYNSLSDLSKEYGVSRSTVTRWFEDSGRINSKLELRINGKVYKKSYLEELAQKYGISSSLVRSRLKKGLPVDSEKIVRERKLYDFRGKKRSLKEISELTGIKRETLIKRQRSGIPFESPVQSGGRKKYEYEFEGQNYTLKELAKELGLPLRVLQARIKQGTDLRAPYHPRTTRYFYNDGWLSLKEIERLTGLSAEEVQKMADNGELDSGV